MVDLTLAVLGLATGVACVVLFPLVFVRQLCDSVVEKSLFGLMTAGGACFFFGVGGLSTAALVGAFAVGPWLRILVYIGFPMLVVGAAGGGARDIWRRRAASRT